MIHIEDITLERASAGKGNKAQMLFQNFSAYIRQGETVALTGASGAGKTTLLRLIAGLEQPDAGRIMVSGKCFMSFHEERLLEYMTAEENLLLIVPGRTIQMRGKKALHGEIEILLRAFYEDYELIRKRRVAEYSAGMKRRLSVARALYAATLCETEAVILLLDEPFAGLDESTKKRVMDYLIEWKNQYNTVTIVYTTHSLSEESMPETGEIKIG